MSCHVITEGPTDAVLLRELLKPEFGPGGCEVDIMSAGGWSGADSLARSILAVHKEPVALVVDADTLDPGRILERRRFLEHSLEEAGAPSMWRVFLAVPVIEALLFADGATLEAILDRRVPGEAMVRGRYEPTAVLQELAAGKNVKRMLAERLPGSDLSALRTHPLLRDLRTFLAHACNGRQGCASGDGPTKA